MKRMYKDDDDDQFSCASFEKIRFSIHFLFCDEKK